MKGSVFFNQTNKKENEGVLRVGDIITCSFAVLKKKRLPPGFRKDKKKKKYLWSVVHFSGACIKITNNIAILQNYSNLNSFTFKCLLGSPNLLTWFLWSNKLRGSKRSRLFTVKKHKAIVHRLRFT